MHRMLVGAALVALLTGCGGGTDEQQAEMTQEEALRVARADSVARAGEQFDPAVFDTINWESDQARWERGGVVWSFTCRRCHGSDGRGQGEDAVEFQFTVPDLTASDWPYAGDIPEIRRRIFVGHESEMPSLGLIGLSYPDVDASAHYIDDLLRGPEE